MNMTQYLVPLREVDRELNKQMKELQGPGAAPLQRARMSNLVVFCNSLEQSILINEQISDITLVHPTRTILLVGEAGIDRDLTARVTVRPIGAAKHHVCVEMVTLHAGGANVERLPFAVRALLLGDLPVNLWWQVPVPPPLAGSLLYDLGDQAQQIIYDSLDWPDPTRGVIATATWLEQIERHGATANTASDGGRWRVASDLNWRRLKFWRRLLTQAIDPASAPGAAENVQEILVEHGPSAVIQAWLLASWLARQLSWRVQTGRLTPAVEMAWQFATPKGTARMIVRRHEAGPADIHGVKVKTILDNRPVTLNVTSDGPNRLGLCLEGVDSAPRTMTITSQSAVDLIGRQLSDRERDPTFRESMVVAQVMAQSVRS